MGLAGRVVEGFRDGKVSTSKPGESLCGSNELIVASDGVFAIVSTSKPGESLCGHVRANN